MSVFSRPSEPQVSARYFKIKKPSWGGGGGGQGQRGDGSSVFQPLVRGGCNF